MLKEGHSQTPKDGQKVTFHCTFAFENGTKYASSRDRGKPFEIIVGPGKGISGFYEGIQKVRLGSRVKMTVSLVSQFSTSLTVKSFRIVIWNSW